jgi:outer membrane protein TolC
LGAQREREAAQREREAAQTWVPPMSLGLGWRRLDSQGQAGQGFALEWGVDLPWGGEREARRAQAQGADERAASDLEMLEDERGAELRRLHEALLGLRAQAQERRGALERAREFLALAQDGYARGQLDLLEVLEASRLCLEDEQALLDLELDARLRAVALDLWTLQEEP